MNKRNEIDNDLWLASQIDAINRITPQKHIDVTDSVMERIAAMPTPTAKRHRKPITIVTSAAAACFAAVIIVSVFISRNNIQAATQFDKDLSIRFSDIYYYCSDYAADDSTESAAYLDNPITNFM